MTKTFSVLITLLLAVTLAAAQQTALTNADVITMLHAGLGDAVVLAKIQSSPAHFDTSASALAAMKKSGASDKVILAIVDRAAAAASQAPEQPAAAPVASHHAPVPLNGARVYIANMKGFDTYLAAAFTKKQVPMTVVGSRQDADYVLEGTSKSQKAGWAKMLIQGSAQSNESASVQLVDVSDGHIVWAYSVNKGNSFHGEQSTAEACAKHLKNFIQKGK